MTDAAPPIDEPVETAPGFEPGQFHALDPAHVTVSRLGYLISSAVLTPIALAGLLLTGAGFWMSLAGSGLAGLLLLARTIWWPPVAYRHQSYMVSDRTIEIRRGVLWKVIISIPRSRVQHTDVNQGPIERAYGLGHLVIHTAGSSNASVGIVGLHHSTALAIRDYLLQADTGDAV